MIPFAMLRAQMLSSYGGHAPPPRAPEPPPHRVEIYVAAILLATVVLAGLIG